MGVNGLWTILHPCARPIKLETLNKKRLAVDASIWIYQFLKAVRDKEGNALRNSHVVGFFRRICKLLFFGIKPVFVFDGGAPGLKRQTIAARKRRREGRREDAVRTAGKLLALQVQRRAEEENEERKRREREKHLNHAEEEAIPEDAVYVDELLMTQQERRQNRQFKKKDQYHLPDLEGSIETMGAPDDPRIMSHEELEAYARQFHSGEDINLYDFSKIDFDSPFFVSLPASDRYNILNAARLRSRLRMGYSKDQLDTMFPDRMAFSKFQIDRVKERNDLTQRLMNLNGSNGDEAFDITGGASRIAGEKGREYVLVKNDAVEGGWALGVVSGNKEGDRNQPIDVDRLAKRMKIDDEDEDEDEDEEWEDEDGGFEDVPIEGLNRLPKVNKRNAFEQVFAERRRDLYESRKETAEVDDLFDDQNDLESDSLFVKGDGTNHQKQTLGPATGGRSTDKRSNADDEEDDLSRAIAMSLESNFQLDWARSKSLGQNKATQNETIQQKPQEATANTAGNASNGVSSGGFLPDDDSDDDTDFQAALAKSRQVAIESRKTGLGADIHSSVSQEKNKTRPRRDPFDGPLPFEKLASITGQSQGGGHTKSTVKADGEKAPALPPWFSGDLQKGLLAQRALEQRQTEESNLRQEDDERQPPILHKAETKEVIEIDSDDERQTQASNIQDVEPPAGEQGDVEMLMPTPRESSRTVESKETELVRDADLDMTTDVTAPFEEENRRAAERNVSEAFRNASSQVAQARTPSPEFEDVLPPESNLSEPILDEREDLGTGSPPIFSHDEATDVVIKDEEGDGYSDPEDDQLFQQLAAEAEEHARFASTLNHKTQTQNQEDYERELRALRNQQKKDRRDADEVSNVMITECQQLLTLFGLPYITAPMEAEAQCAELVRLGLVDGIVTDDSDCFLFGGTRVYKNMFNQAKYVECYLAQDLAKEFDLDRNKLIRFAHLLGSDYTEGIPGVGPVTALEILSEFNSDAGLEDFKEWWQGVQMGIQFPEDAKSPFRKKFRRNSTRIFLPPTFPSVAVTQAYLHPEVDSSRDPFQWGVPDLDAIRAFLMATIGWSKERTDEVLVPVIRDMNRREYEGTQSNLTAFFGGGTGAGAFAPRRVPESMSKSAARRIASRRMEGALGKLKEGAKRKRRSTGARAGAEDEDDDDEHEQDGDGILGQGDGEVRVDDGDSIDAQNTLSTTKDSTTQKKGPKRKRKAKVVSTSASGPAL